MYKYLECIGEKYEPVFSRETTREFLVEFCGHELVEELEKIAGKDGIVTYADGFAITVVLVG